MNVLCRVAWHRWTVWGTPEEIPCLRGVLTGFSIPQDADEARIVRVRQTRQCANCGVIEYRWLQGPT